MKTSKNISVITSEVLTLEIGDFFGFSNKSFCVTEIDTKKGIYKAQWQGEF